MKNLLLILAGGSGTRMESDIPKQYIEINGKEILQYTLEAFERLGIFDETVIVVPEIDKERSLKYHKIFPEMKIEFILGGQNRFESSRNGLEALEGDGLVFIHDAARPFVSRDLIHRLVTKASSLGNAIPVVPISSSLRLVSNEGSQIIDREAIRAVQTPQVFRLSEIKEAMKTGYRPSFTDDASVLEAMGKKINLVDGDSSNVKLTSPEDLDFARYIIEKDQL